MQDGAKINNEKISLLEALQLVAKYAFKNDEFYGSIAKIVSVDDVAQTCEVSFFDDEPNLTGVKIQQVSNTYGLYIKPSVDSIVIINYTDPINAYISLTSQVDEIIFQNGTNEGLVKVVELTNNINTRETRINAIVTALQAIATAAALTTSAPVTGTSLASFINTAIAGILTPIPTTTQSSLENDKFKH